MDAPKLTCRALPLVARWICTWSVDIRKPLGRVLSSSFSTKLLPRLSFGVIAQVMWYRPYLSVVACRPCGVTTRTPARPSSPSSCRPLRLASLKTLRSEEHTSELQSPYDLV